MEDKMDYTHDLSPRNIIKLAFQYQETEYVPYIVELSEYQKNALTKYYGNFDWQSKVIEYLSVTGGITGVDNFFSLEQGVNSLLDLDRKPYHRHPIHPETHNRFQLCKSEDFRSDS